MQHDKLCLRDFLVNSLGFSIILLYMCVLPFETSYLLFLLPEVLWALSGGKKLPEMFIKNKKQCILGNVLQLDLILVIYFNYLFIKMVLHL